MTEEEYCDLVESQWPEKAGQEASRELIALVFEAVREHPYSSRLHIMKGDLIQLAADDVEIDLEEALACYQRAVELDPGSEEGWTEIGYFLDVVRDDPPAAEEAFRQAVALGGSVDSYAGLARVLAEQGREKEALAVLMPCECPWSEDARIREMKAEIEQGDWDPVD